MPDLDDDNIVKLQYQIKRPAVNIEFNDVAFSVPDGIHGSKVILRGINGVFKSGQLTAILGPSGAGKSTLLNILAGYKCSQSTGSILINGEHRNIKQFRKLSRFIMQEDLLQPFVTVEETMRIAAKLKLANKYSETDTRLLITEILTMLRLNNSRHTRTEQLSGGERKRLAIAQELLNNPPVIFLDEPTTGLDDLSCSQCVTLLKMLAKGGRTVICSIHNPSAKLFSMFDHVYIVAQGQCVFQGVWSDIVPFLAHIGLTCPNHYNPADFIIEVSNGEYGNYVEKMVSSLSDWKTLHAHSLNHTISAPDLSTQNTLCDDCNLELNTWSQFKILLCRMLLQNWRDYNYLVLKGTMFLFLALIVSILYFNMGHDGSKTIFNFGFLFTCIMVFLYVPLLPILLYFPMQVQLLKREHFNQWYNLRAYFCALSVANLPAHLILGTTYLSITYVATGQPLELHRMVMFYTICLLTALVSESFGLMVSSTLNILNGMFVGPVLAVPFMLLSVQGIGNGLESVPVITRIAMYFSYLRYGLEGIGAAIYGGDREVLPCPDSEDYCPYRQPKYLLKFVGLDYGVYWVDVTVLLFCLILFRSISFYLLKQRLSPNRAFTSLHSIGKLVKSYIR